MRAHCDTDQCRMPVVGHLLFKRLKQAVPVIDFEHFVNVGTRCVCMVLDRSMLLCMFSFVDTYLRQCCHDSGLCVCNYVCLRACVPPRMHVPSAY
jgi:hypothetical protein